MKKHIKRISALVLSVACCLVLCSCSAIKEMRQSQAFYGENEGEIIWGGQVYKSLNIYEFPEGLETQIGDVCYITEKDVPVLLSQLIGDDMYYNYNKTILNRDYSSYYVREDVYDYVENLMEYPYLDKYCVEVDDGFSYNVSYEPAKQRYLDAIAQIASSENKVSLDMYYSDALDTVDWTSIYKCDEQMIFLNEVYKIEEDKSGDIYVTEFDIEMKYEDYSSSYQTYRVPDDKKAMMKELLTLGEDGLR